jgi:hypothetical protein
VNSIVLNEIVNIYRVLLGLEGENEMVLNSGGGGGKSFISIT